MFLFSLLHLSRVCLEDKKEFVNFVKARDAHQPYGFETINYRFYLRQATVVTRDLTCSLALLVAMHLQGLSFLSRSSATPNGIHKSVTSSTKNLRELMEVYVKKLPLTIF